jgi:zinc D-Ala-D-Ala carboxypeptidase
VHARVRWRAGAPALLALAILGAACAPVRPADGPGGNGRLPLTSLEAVRMDCWVTTAIAEPLRRMLSAANADGVALAPEGYFSHDPIAVSGCYRSYDEQVVARDYFCAEGDCAVAAVPGTSTHGMGRAVDFRDEAGELTFDSKGYAWLVEHASAYGFSHPEWARPEGRNPEPWHWEA